MKQYKIVINGTNYKGRTLPDLNDYLHECDRHPRAGGAMKRQFQMVVVSALRMKLRGAKAKHPIRIKCDFYEADRRRDKDNILGFTHKVLLDALQDVKYIPNDNWEWIDRLEAPDYYVDKARPRIEVTITEVDGNEE